MSQEQSALKMKMYTLVEHLENIQVEKDLMKAAIAEIVATHGEDAKQVKKAANIMYKNKIQEFKDDMNSLEQFLSKVS